MMLMAQTMMIVTPAASGAFEVIEPFDGDPPRFAMYGKDADYAMTGNTNTICSAEDIDDVTAAINGLLDKITVGGPGAPLAVGLAPSLMPSPGSSGRLVSRSPTPTASSST
jgi:hypothetical protein